MTQPPPPDLSHAEALRKVRESLGLTQEQWAARLGVSTRTVSRWEQGVAEPGSAAQKATIAAQAGGALPRELSSWLGLAAGFTAGSASGAALGAALGTALGPAGTMLGAAAGMAAGNAWGQLVGRTRAYLREQTVLGGLKAQAAAQGVEWKTYRERLIEGLLLAREGGLSLDEMTHLLASEE